MRTSRGSSRRTMTMMSIWCWIGARAGMAWRGPILAIPALMPCSAISCDGQYANPFRIAAFTAEGWSRDVSEAIAKDLRCDAEGRDIPECVRDFVDRHEGRRRLNSASG
jgi:hypothetical protein